MSAISSFADQRSSVATGRGENMARLRFVAWMRLGSGMAGLREAWLREVWLRESWFPQQLVYWSATDEPCAGACGPGLALRPFFCRCSTNSVRPGRSQDRVRVNFPLVDGLYRVKWMADSWFPSLDLVFDHIRHRIKLALYRHSTSKLAKNPRLSHRARDPLVMSTTNGVRGRVTDLCSCMDSNG